VQHVGLSRSLSAAGSARRDGATAEWAMAEEVTVRSRAASKGGSESGAGPRPLPHRPGRGSLHERCRSGREGPHLTRVAFRTRSSGHSLGRPWHQLMNSAMGPSGRQVVRLILWIKVARESELDGRRCDYRCGLQSTLDVLRSRSSRLRGVCRLSCRPGRGILRQCSRLTAPGRDPE